MMSWNDPYICVKELDSRLRATDQSTRVDTQSCPHIAAGKVMQ